VVSSIQNYGRDAITAQFKVDQATCDTTPGGMGTPGVDCDVPYGLTVYVDGVQLCTNPTFGVITNYWDN
jgi:hypothetical protein